MNRTRLLVGCGLTFAIVAATAAIAWSATPGSTSATGDANAAASNDSVGVAGPLGPQELSVIPSFIKNVTFSNNQLGQAQYIAARLPAGRYLVQVHALDAPSGIGPDCMGVSFPLAPSGAAGPAYTGYVSVANNGDTAAVSCFEPASGAHSTATYRLTYIPVTGAP